MKQSNTFIKIGLIYTISNVIIKGMAFLTTPIFTRLMSQAEYGSFSNISSWANIISIIAALSLSSSISRAKYDCNESIDEYITSITIIGSAFALILWGAVELNIDFFENFFGMNRVYIRSIMLYSVFSPCIQSLLTKYRMYNEYKKVILLTWITLLVTTVASLGMTILMANKLSGRVIGTYAVVAIVDIVIWLYVIWKGKRITFKYLKYALALSLPLLVHELSGVLLTSSGKIIINRLCGEHEGALFSIAYTIAMLITMVMSSVNQAWVPWFFDKLAADDTSSVKKIVPAYTAVFTIGCIAVMLIGPEMVLIFGGRSYMPAINVIPPICFSVSLQFVYTLYVNVEFYLKKTKFISFATVGAAIINIGANYLLIPRFGYVAAAYASVIGFAFMLLFHYLVCRKTVYNQLFNIKTLLLNVAICFVAMIVVLLLYKNNIARLIVLGVLIAVIVILACVNRKKLKK